MILLQMLQVDLQRLQALSQGEAEAALEKLASLRCVMLGLPIRWGTISPCCATVMSLHAYVRRNCTDQIVRLHLERLAYIHTCIEHTSVSLSLGDQAEIECICRQELHHLAEGTSQEGLQAIQSRPGAPLWLHGRPGRLTAMFPVFMLGSADDPLLSAFIQVLLRCEALYS